MPPSARVATCLAAFALAPAAARSQVNWKLPLLERRSRHAMAYDNARQRTLLFGGYNGSVLGDTWDWDGRVWTRQAPATSPPIAAK